MIIISWLFTMWNISPTHRHFFSQNLTKTQRIVVWKKKLWCWGYTIDSNQMRSDRSHQESDPSDNHNAFRLVVNLLQFAFFYPFATFQAVFFNLWIMKLYRNVWFSLVVAKKVDQKRTKQMWRGRNIWSWKWRSCIRSGRYEWIFKRGCRLCWWKWRGVIFRQWK